MKIDKLKTLSTQGLDTAVRHQLSEETRSWWIRNGDYELKHIISIYVEALECGDHRSAMQAVYNNFGTCDGNHGHVTKIICAIRKIAAEQGKANGKKKVKNASE